jgi:hypothetical protein
MNNNKYRKMLVGEREKEKESESDRNRKRENGISIEEYIIYLKKLP